MVSQRIAAVLATTLLITACSDAPSPLVPELRNQYKSGYPLDKAIDDLKARNTTFAVHDKGECETLARAQTMSIQLRPQGGPCIFGKIPVSKNWLGGHTDVILQLVFDREGKLVDGDIEEIRIPFGWSTPAQ